MKKGCEHVTVVKSIYRTTWEDYQPVTYEIEVDNRSVSGISEFSARYIYDELGKFLNMKEGGQS